MVLSLMFSSLWYSKRTSKFMKSEALGLQIKVKLFEPKNMDSLESTINKAMNTNDDDYERMSINAKNFAEKNFNPEKHLIELINIYHEIME